MIISSGFRELLFNLTEKEFILLAQSDPYFITDFCYMLTLEIQLDKESKN